MEILCTYLVGIVVTFFVFAFRHHLPWGGMRLEYGLPFLLSYSFKHGLLSILWPVTLVVWAVRGFPAAPYDLRLLPNEARAQGKRA